MSLGSPVGRRLDRAQVPGLHAVLAQRGQGPGDRQRVRAVLPTHPADQPVVLELGQLGLADLGGVEQLAAGQIGRRLTRRVSPS